MKKIKNVPDKKPRKIYVKTTKNVLKRIKKAIKNYRSVHDIQCHEISYDDINKYTNHIYNHFNDYNQILMVFLSCDTMDNKQNKQESLKKIDDFSKKLSEFMPATLDQEEMKMIFSKKCVYCFSILRNL